MPASESQIVPGVYAKARFAIATICTMGVMLLMWLPVVDPLPEIELWYEDKWQHAAVYAALTLVWCWAGLKPWRAAILTAVISLLLECGQHFIPYRGFEGLDLAANFSGCSLAYLCLRALSRRKALAGAGALSTQPARSP